MSISLKKVFDFSQSKQGIMSSADPYDESYHIYGDLDQQTVEWLEKHKLSRLKSRFEARSDENNNVSIDRLRWLRLPEIKLFAQKTLQLNLIDTIQLVKAVQTTQREQGDLSKSLIRLTQQDEQFIDMIGTELKTINQCKANCHASVES